MNIRYPIYEGVYRILTIQHSTVNHPAKAKTSAMPERIDL